MKTQARLALAGLIIINLAGFALADDAPTDKPADTPSAVSAPAPDSVQNGSNPLSGVGGLGTGSDATAGSSLQPNTSTSLQGSNQDSGTLSAPTQGLQGTAPSDSALQVLGAEADGDRHDPNSQNLSWYWIGIVMAVIVAAGAAWFLRRPNRPSATAPANADQTDELAEAPQDNTETEAEPSPETEPDATNAADTDIQYEDAQAPLSETAPNAAAEPATAKSPSATDAVVSSAAAKPNKPSRHHRKHKKSAKN